MKVPGRTPRGRSETRYVEVAGEDMMLAGVIIKEGMEIQCGDP